MFRGPRERFRPDGMGEGGMFFTLPQGIRRRFGEAAG